MIQKLFLNQKAKEENVRLLSAHAKQFLTSLFLFLTLLFLPTQFGLHTWPFFSFVSGQRIDYLSPTFYVTDIFLFLLFLLYGKTFFLQIKWFYALPFLFLSIGITYSLNPLAGWWSFVKVGEYCFFAWIIMQQAKNIQQILLVTFSVGILGESLLALVQYVHQGSLDGVFYFLGERAYSTNTPGIANASINGTLVLRPYGTFSHPNVLAGYLLIGMLFLFCTVLFGTKRKKQIILLVILFFGTAGLLVSLSRLAILVWLCCVLGLLCYRFYKSKKWLILCFSAFFIGTIFFLPEVIRGRFLALFTDGEDVSLRLSLLHAAIQMLLTHPIFGVGLHNFLPSLPLFSVQTSFLALQPVHNIFFLVAAETGFPGLFLFLFLFLQAVRVSFKKRSSLIFLWSFVSLVCIFLIGQIDHYFLTLQQGQLLFTLILAAAYPHKTT